MKEIGINMLFVLDGNGTHAGANAIHNECCKRRMTVAVVAINSAYIEAHSAYHGMGIVKSMGRSSGYIAMHASLTSGQIDICLIPEFLYTILVKSVYIITSARLHHKCIYYGSAAICVAEGAGQVLVEPGTPQGSNIISQMRSHILWMEKRKCRKSKDVNKETSKDLVTRRSGVHIVAPCPHDGACPLEKSGKYCHIVQRVQRTTSQCACKFVAFKG
ncbi:hypothetical protein QYF36_009881 [Acer negundo]|nr:hypothetical protein QYF36_009881 [Acer negundo]